MLVQAKPTVNALAISASTIKSSPKSSMDNYIFSRFNFSDEYRAELIEAVRRMNNFECGGHRLYDGKDTHYMQNAVEITEFIIALKRHEEAVGKKLKSFLEIGYSAGINNSFVNKFFQFQNIVAVDIISPGGVSFETFFANLRFKNISLVCGDSKDNDTIERTELLGRGGYDLIFLDGGHQYEDITADFRNYSPMLSSNGAIGFHDIKSEAFPGVGKFWGEVKAEHGNDWEFQEFYESGNHTSYGIGMMIRKTS